MLKLYHSPGSCSLAVHVVLEEIGADYELMRVFLEKGQQRSPEHLARNPLGRVPVLDTDQGLITEIPAILAYLAVTHPAANLQPSGTWALTQLASFNAFMSSTVHPHFAHNNRPARWVDSEAAQAEVIAKARIAVADLYKMLDDRIVGPWVMGEQYTTADAYLYAITRWLPRAEIDIARYPKVAAHFAAMSARPAVQRVLAQEGLD
jgi:glutathione S-transferase